MNPRRGASVGLLAVLALLAAACGSGTEPEPGPLAVDGADTSEVTGSSEAAESGDRVEPADGQGLALRVTGTVVEGSLCPGGERPCLPLAGGRQLIDDGDGDGDAPIQVVGQLADGLLYVTEQSPVPVDENDFGDRCEGMTPSRNDGNDPVDLALVDYQRTIPDSLAVVWVSPSNVFHLGVVDDAEPHRAALVERGLGDSVCVVGQFPRTESELQELSASIGPVIEGWSDDGFDDSVGWGADPFAGTVEIELYRIDAVQQAELEVLGDAIEVRAAIEVLDGTLDDLDAALDDLRTGGPDPVVSVACGSVVFETVPPDIDGFKNIDEEAQAALDTAATGPIAVEAESFVTGYDWSIASRTDDEMVLFGVASSIGQGQGANEGSSFAVMTFRQIDEQWSLRGFGGCNLSIEALGLGPASVILDPDREPDPGSTELPVLINERDCASGQAPVDREIVPVVTETDTTIELAVLVAPVKGSATCPGNPWHPITVTLEAPLGDRTVLDASVQPPEPRPWPPLVVDSDS